MGSPAWTGAGRWGSLAHRPQAAPSAMSTISSPPPSLLLSRAPAKNSPSPQPQHRRGGPSRGRGRESGQEEAPGAHTDNAVHAQPEPRWKCTHVHGQVVQAAKHISVACSGTEHRASTGPRLGSARLAWLRAGVQHSLTLCVWSSTGWTHPSPCPLGPGRRG